MNNEAASPEHRPTKSGTSAGALERRDFLGKVTTVTMVGGLAAGYGTFFALAGRFLFPSQGEAPWLFVAGAAQIRPGQSVSFVSPAGVPVTVKRSSSAEEDRPPVVEQFVALSSTCPHLGCRVHWESHDDRFFCPCHNGTFDPDGKPTGGPPLAANQPLPRYPLRLESGLLLIQIPVELVGTTSDASVVFHEIIVSHETRIAAGPEASLTSRASGL